MHDKTEFREKVKDYENGVMENWKEEIASKIK